MSINNNKYENIYIVVKQVKIVGSKEIFELQFVDGNANSKFSSSNQTTE
jgi:intein-encoded DNA endonuclease-like protein